MQKDHIFVPINSGGDSNTSSVHHKKSFRRVSEPQFYLEPRSTNKCFSLAKQKRCVAKLAPIVELKSRDDYVQQLASTEHVRPRIL